MEINQAAYVMSNTDVGKCPKPDKPEYAFIGRSNVGKSSLINMLTEKKSLAKTSQKPGKTRTINHFLIDDTWYLVDLPGYGWAKVSKTDREAWAKMIQTYLTQRENLFCVFVLVDSRHAPQANDLEFMRWLATNKVPFVILFTKADKQKAHRTHENVNYYVQQMLIEWEVLPPYFVTSAESREGREGLLQYIGELNKKYQSVHL